MGEGLGIGPIVAIDLGGTRFRIALVGLHGRVLQRVSEESRSQEGPARVVQRMVQAARGLLAKGGLERAVAVGAGVAGPVDSKGVILDPPSLIGWRNVPMKAMLAEGFAAPVWVGNDANLGALGEHAYGSGRGVDDLVYLALGTGVGGGVISGGALITGWHGLASEMGHIILRGDGPRGRCGHTGCLESLVSGTAIAQRAQEGLAQGRRSILMDLLDGDLARLRAEHVFQAAGTGDAFSGELVQHVAHDLGLGIVSLVHLFDPKVFILGGGVSQNWHLLAPMALRTVGEQAMRGFLDGLIITVSTLGDDAGLLGAAVLVERGEVQEGERG